MSRKKKTVLIDLSGTIHIENDEVPGSIDALKMLRTCTVNVRFVTNTTKESKQILFERLTKIGFEIDFDEIFSSLTAAVNRIKKSNLRPYLLVDDKAIADFEGFPVADPNCVVVGLAPEKLSFECMNKAFDLLINGAQLIAIHKAKYYKRTDGLALGPGPFVTALEYASGVSAHIVGKPSSDFFLSAIKDYDCQPADCYMIGDDVWGDIEGAASLGMMTFVVKTGKYLDGDEFKIQSKTRVVDRFSDAVAEIIKDISLF
ncbi:hypothetical protein LOTGIDRAFT_113609 [Lottia gigantea]|uniref:Haloacid dehalogenase-like hydrolase domain-containing protein 2 n=1 Tax=Lottia gigantea TaxID=225164 RepID=V4CC63_LOTGI|nr:hypothetical protein LOTGIDRAFT_113609 [Lottia gigantea]ESO99469.1 hypothetical protein LOTGIDRAFT_113609 [Lottia gigantea]